MAKSNQKVAKELSNYCIGIIRQLNVIERYWTFPGTDALESMEAMIERKEFTALRDLVSDYVRSLSSEAYRLKSNRNGGENLSMVEYEDTANDVGKSGHYFETLFVDDDLSDSEIVDLKEKFSSIKDADDEFRYEIIISSSFQDALIALLFNYNIQSVVIRYGIRFESDNELKGIKPFISDILQYDYQKEDRSNLALKLAHVIRAFRPEIDLYYVTDRTLDQTDSETLSLFRRIFYRQEDVQEAHLSIRKGINERYNTPFFKALVDYSRKPTGVFHAMPISRGNSVFKSNWIKDMGEFYGRNIFLAETSATTGGLDSLLQPTGALKRAQRLAASAFGAQHTYFATNGTSTANKIVLQGLVRPGEIVLIDRDCHKSHHYAIVLSGAYPVYLDSYPIQEYSMYGAVPSEEIIHKLQKLKDAGRLDKVKMLILTNCTFDGLVYNVQGLMEEVLAIKTRYGFPLG